MTQQPPLPCRRLCAEGSAAPYRDSTSENGRFVKEAAFAEALDAERGDVDKAGAAVEDKIGEDAAGGGRVHDAVAAEAVGEVETLKLRDAAEDSMPTTRPPGATAAAMSAVMAPVPQPTSSTVMPGRSSAASRR